MNLKNFYSRIIPARFSSYWSKIKNHYSKTIFKKTERLDFDKGDYPIPHNWKNVFKEKLLFSSNQIGLGYFIK